MLRLAVFAVVVAVALCFPFEEMLGWEAFKAKHQKQYSLEENTMRRSIYEYHLRVIQQHNMEYAAGRHTYRLGVNEYADWTNGEFSHFMNGYRMSKFSQKSSILFRGNNVGDLPNKVDWRQKGYVTGVKNQMQCGSCWAFSATGSLEGQHFNKTGNLVSLSEQNLVDCSRPEGNMGCQGGLMDQAFEYIKINDGIDTEMSYPYTAQNGQCHFMMSDVGATDNGYVDIASMDEMALKKAVAMVGPISVAMDASRTSFQLYKDGIYSDPQCSSTQLDHGVLAIGYGTEMSQDYWLVKNSWGTSWGMKGFFMLARNMNNMCGIATAASYPTV